MARKKWSAQPIMTPDILRSREKRKWQITLRRYVLDRNPCVSYAPYFGLDIENLRNWFEIQFKEGWQWENFGKMWQFEHIIPVNCFDFSNEQDLKLCWNFANIRAAPATAFSSQNTSIELLRAKAYFKLLYDRTQQLICQQLLQKIEKLEFINDNIPHNQLIFLNQKRAFLDLIQDYSTSEFELLNSGRTIDEVTAEMLFLKKF